ncbi:MAG: glycosyltransferase family 4 protein [Phycisphaeraceae bacterium]
MNILMTTDTVGGVWTYAIELCAALRDRGSRVTLATMGPAPSDAQRQEAARAGASLRESTWRLEWMDDPWDDVDRAGDWLLELEREIQPDVIHLSGYAHANLPWRAPTLVVAHSCVWSWWRAVHGEDPPSDWREYHGRVSLGLAAADLVLAPTWAMLAQIESCYRRLPRMGVIPNARRPELFEPGEKEDFVFAAGRLWDEAKNIAALDFIAGDLPWPVRVAGESRHPEGAAEADLGVECLGQLTQAEMVDWLGRASIYALPARYEPFGLSALEAALSGCALVLGDIPSLREVWGPAAVYVSPDDPAELRQALVDLIGRPRDRERLARKARERALEMKPGVMAGAYERAYRLMLDGADLTQPAPVRGPAATPAIGSSERQAG